MLEVGSAIDPDVWRERGVRSTTGGRDLPEGFSQRQRRRGGGILFIAHRPNGQRSCSYRPNALDPESPGHRYEQPCKVYGGPGNILDVHPSVRHLIADTSVPVIFVEGIKKADAVISATRRAGAEVLVVAIFGVWNWLSGGEPIPDMFDIPVEGRRVTICFDSDMLHNPQVQDAAGRLAEHLIGRGAEVWITYLHDQPDGSKTGADDYFAGGGTFAELQLLARRYDPEDFVRVRLSRDERLRNGHKALQRTYDAMPATKVGECSERATFRALVRCAKRVGEPTDEGIVVRGAIRTLATETHLSTRSQLNALKRLEEKGYIKRIAEPERKTKKQGSAYLLYAACAGRALSKQYEEKRQQQNEPQEQSAEGKSHRNTDLYAGVYLARASAEVPELRYSKVVHTWEWREGRRVVVHSDYIYRIGKSRQEVLMYLVDNGDEATVDELFERFSSARTRLRDFRRRKLDPLLGWRYSRDKDTGQERRLEVGPPMVSCAGGVVRILPEWREALEEHRKQTGELEDNKRQTEDYKRQRDGYHNRDRTPADEQPSPLLGKEKVARLVEERRREDRERWVEAQRKKVGETAATFLADEMAGVTGIRFAEVRQRWARRGGSKEELRTAVLYGPWRFKRESDGDIYIYHEGAKKRAAKRVDRAPKTPKPRKMPPKVDGVYQHGGECDCWLCGEDIEPSAARVRSTA